ncbi:membrane protein [Sorangium cellulosum]|uniref:Probable membrane transporter protein n=1 Tax=Sorangium cellulosum TaxID=56 RepID=A0A4P2PXM5_SORCE|nr:sulfite exporter TauE/SafE family protein [Sorangium cellulosum]AUX21306.1 membrane protein [Sorangium cellulosum]
MDLTGAALLAGAAAVAGVINAVAGGGTLVSFPAAIAAGLPPLAANATNAVALTPASLASAWAYRRELARDHRVLRVLLLPSLLGGLAGSALLLVTPQRVFDAAVPALVLVATLLLFWQNLRPPRPSAGASASDDFALPSRPGVVFLLQLLVSIYGGYFGAGIGIMMLALLSSFAGGADIHRLNAIKTVLAGLINGVAAVAFLFAGAVDPVATPIMMGAAMLGSFAGAVVARRIEPRKVRWFVVALGLVLTAKLAWDRLGA